MVDAPDLEQIDKVNEIGLTSRQRDQVDQAIKKSRRGLVGLVTLVCMVFSVAWGLMVGIGLDQVAREWGAQQLTEFIQQGGANEVAERLLQEPSPIADALRDYSTELSEEFRVRVGMTPGREVDVPIEGDYSFCFLTYMLAPENSCTCTVRPVNASGQPRQWGLLAAGAQACECRAQCVLLPGEASGEAE